MLVFRGITRLADQPCVDIHLLLIEFFWKLDDAKGPVIEINMIEKAIKMFNELRMTTIMSKHSDMKYYSTFVLSVPSIQLTLHYRLLLYSDIFGVLWSGYLLYEGVIKCLLRICAFWPLFWVQRKFVQPLWSLLISHFKQHLHLRRDSGPVSFRTVP